MSYLALRHVHVTLVVITALLFVGRFWLLTRGSVLPRWLKILPHVNDTFLLLSAIAMLVVANINPLVSGWLLAKIAGLFVYVGIGFACLKAPAGSSRQRRYFILSVAVFSYIVLVALTKRPMVFL